MVCNADKFINTLSNIHTHTSGTNRILEYIEPNIAYSEFYVY